MATSVVSHIETLRRERGLSQRNLAQTAGITRQAVGALESGRMQPSVGVALRLARALGIERTGSRAASAGAARFEIATTEAGWIFARGNPLGLHGASDLVAKRARIAIRPAGAGARRLLDEQLRRANLDAPRIEGYDRELSGQLDAGRAIAQGFADAAVGTASVAHVFGAEFVPLQQERCTLVVPTGALGTPEIRHVLDALRSAPYRRDLQALEAYDVTNTGERYA